MKIAFKSRYGALRVLTIPDEELHNDEVNATLEFSDVHFIRQGETFIDPDGGPFIGIGASLYTLIDYQNCPGYEDLFVTGFECVSGSGTDKTVYALTLKRDSKAFIKKLEDQIDLFESEQKVLRTRSDYFDTYLETALLNSKKAAIKRMKILLKKYKAKK